MKKALFAMVIALASVCMASPANDESVKVVELSNTQSYNLAKEDAKEIRVYVAYPGPQISNVCGLELRADATNQVIAIDNLIGNLLITPHLDDDVKVTVKNSTTIDINIDPSLGGYGVWFDISTYDGSKISDLVYDKLGQKQTARELILLTKSCN